jgi:hypothetical protein
MMALSGVRNSWLGSHGGVRVHRAAAKPLTLELQHLTLTLAGTNLTQAKHQTFIGSAYSPSATYIDDRQYLAGVRYRF